MPTATSPDIQAEDPALVAVRAMVASMPNSMAVFDADGTCLVANQGFALRSARSAGQAHASAAEVPQSFSPDGVRRWTMVSVPDDTPSRRAGDFHDMLADALPVMCNAKDTESRYLFMNRFQAALYGVSPDAAVGRTAGDLMGEPYGATTREIDREVIRSRRAVPFYEEDFTGVDGVPRRWLTSKVPLAGADGTIWGVATVSVDITERSRLAEILRQAKEEAEATSLVKSHFLQAMTHELRTPLNAVIGFAEILQQQKLGPIGAAAYVDYAAHILTSGQHLLRLINDILDYARIESGSLELQFSPLDLAALAQGVGCALGQAAADAGVRLIAEAGPPVIIRGDERRLRQALLNVVGNAVKFTPDGGQVVITVAMTSEGAAEIMVRDSGIGIAASHLGHVFEPFWQADSGLDRGSEGTGIGLPLARELVALHGGRLELTSTLGEGTQVRLIVPISQNEVRAAAPA
jgi:PAS domain S-box-containing protein